MPSSHWGSEEYLPRGDFRLTCAIECLKAPPIPTLQTLGATLESWKDEIGRMWRFTKTNSITEDLHNKMELISRRTFGFRDFTNYRLRVEALCA
jgi:transposase